MLMLTALLSAPAGIVKVGLPVPSAWTTHPPSPQLVVQSPEVGSHVAVPGHVRCVPPHTPAVQMSLVVQAFPSLHWVPSGAATMSGQRGGPPPVTHLSEAST